MAAEATKKNMRQRKLSRMATGLLIVLSMIYFATLLEPNPSVWGGRFLRSVCEAGMVGGLADWFAIEALFRHPLRIPIPHTALLRKRKDHAADNIGKFIQDYILVPEQIRETIVRKDLTKIVGTWLTDKGNAELCAHFIAKYGALALRDASPSVKRSVTRLTDAMIGGTMSGTVFSSLFIDLLRQTVAASRLDPVLRQMATQLDENQFLIEKCLRTSTRLWVSRPLSRQMTKALSRATIERSKSHVFSNTETNRKCEEDLSKFTDKIESAATSVSEMAMSSEFGGDPRLAKKLGELTADTLRLVVEVQKHELEIVIAATLRRAGKALLDESNEAGKLNSQLAELAEEVVVSNRRQVGEFVTETLKEWETDLLVSRIETEIGSDLQFIRINGAILGSGIGGLIFALEHIAGVAPLDPTRAL